MRLVASTPNSKPVPEAIRSSLAAISQDDLREVVERISVPRPTGTPENEAVRRSIIELFCCTETGRLGVEVDEAGNVVVGDPRRTKILIGAHSTRSPARRGPTTTPAACPPSSPPPERSAPRRDSAMSPSTARNAAS